MAKNEREEIRESLVGSSYAKIQSQTLSGKTAAEVADDDNDD
ncbi:hypothetical protein [Isoptericola sp. BMS4]|nr:hypothetical protein [Isoptericola sp. BMS4]